MMLASGTSGRLAAMQRPSASRTRAVSVAASAASTPTASRASVTLNGGLKVAPIINVGAG